jgi:hypothetical protein
MPRSFHQTPFPGHSGRGHHNGKPQSHPGSQARVIRTHRMRRPPTVFREYSDIRERSQLEFRRLFIIAGGPAPPRNAYAPDEDEYVFCRTSGACIPLLTTADSVTALLYSESPGCWLGLSAIAVQFRLAAAGPPARREGRTPRGPGGGSHRHAETRTRESFRRGGQRSGGSPADLAHWSRPVQKRLHDDPGVRRPAKTGNAAIWRHITSRRDAVRHGQPPATPATLRRPDPNDTV